MDDVIIIGGSFAGLAGALQLGRARRKITVLDTGLPRNRFAGHSHGLLGHDHKPPLDILAARASSSPVIPRSSWSMLAPIAFPARSTISPSSPTMAKPSGRAACC